MDGIFFLINYVESDHVPKRCDFIEMLLIFFLTSYIESDHGPCFWLAKIKRPFTLNVISFTFKISRALLLIYRSCHGHFFHVTGTILEIFYGHSKNCYGHFFFVENCQGHIFCFTGSFLKIVTVIQKNVTRKKKISTDPHIKSYSSGGNFNRHL